MVFFHLGITTSFFSMFSITSNVFSMPIFFGPYMYNFSSIVQIFLNKGAAIMVKDARQLKDNCSRLLDDPAARKELGEKAKAIVQANTGATLRNMELIRHILVIVGLKKREKKENRWISSLKKKQGNI